MSGQDDWRPGDLAWCIDDRDYDGSKMQINRGHIYTVAEVMDAWDEERDHVLGLVLKEVSALPQGACFEAACFRKINPLTDEERDELLRELDAPVKEPRHA